MHNCSMPVFSNLALSLAAFVLITKLITPPAGALSSDKNETVTFDQGLCNETIKSVKKWHKGIIPYQIRTNYSAMETLELARAMKKIENNTCIKFVPRSTQNDYIYIASTVDGCGSSVGKLGGAQLVSLKSAKGGSGGCMKHSIVIHELMHVVGLEHEHKRFDRDQYLKIHWQNIKEGYQHNFCLINDPQRFYNCAYNYQSIMHYPNWAFGADKSTMTMEPLDKKFLNSMGNSKEAHSNDYEQINRMYKCDTIIEEHTCS